MTPYRRKGETIYQTRTCYSVLVSGPRSRQEQTLRMTVGPSASTDSKEKVCMCVRACTSVCTCVRACVCVWVCLSICLSVCVRACVRVWCVLRACVRARVRACVFLLVQIHIHTIFVCLNKLLHDVRHCQHHQLGTRGGRHCRGRKRGQSPCHDAKNYLQRWPATFPLPFFFGFTIVENCDECYPPVSQKYVWYSSFRSWCRLSTDHMCRKVQRKHKTFMRSITTWSTEKVRYMWISKPGSVKRSTQGTKSFVVDSDSVVSELDVENDCRCLCNRHFATMATEKVRGLVVCVYFSFLLDLPWYRGPTAACPLEDLYPWLGRGNLSTPSDLRGSFQVSLFLIFYWYECTSSDLDFFFFFFASIYFTRMAR